jgi:NADH:ubiquinone reductase (H+-translocating)
MAGRFPACTLVWTAGNTGNPLVASLPLPNRGGRLLVNDYLEVENAPGSVRVSHGLDGHCHDLPFEHLVLALGASTNFFGFPGVEANALALRTINDAVALRSRLISHLEEASAECAVSEHKPMLTFVVAGGGFAGVETIGGINDFVRDAIRFYPALNQADLRMATKQ